MKHDQGGAAEAALASRDLAVTELPTLHGFEHRSFILVESCFRKRSADLTDTFVPVLSISSTSSRELACIEFLQQCYETKLDGHCFGVGHSQSVAKQRALANACEARVAVCVQDNLMPHTLNKGGSVHVEQLRDMDGHVVFSTYYSGSANETVIAELMMRKSPPHYVVAPGYGSQAKKRALYNVLAKLDAMLLRRANSASWIDCALVKSYDSPSNTVPPDPTLVPDFPAEWRTWPDEQGLKVVSVAASSKRQGPAEGPAQWLDCRSLGLRAPVQLALAFCDDEVALSREFHENSKLHKQRRTLPLIDTARMSLSVHQTLSSATRDYRFTREQISLAAEPDAQPLHVARALATRRSSAAFSEEPIQLTELGKILLSSYGVTGKAAFKHHQESTQHKPAAMGLRATPTAGGLNSNDIFVVGRRVDGIDEGLYYFNPDAKCLQLVDSRARISNLADYTGYPDRVRSASAVIILAASLGRIQWKYGNRGYRMALLDCGHLAQSLVLAASELHLVAHPIGGFVDDELNTFTGLDGVDDCVLHMLLLGKRRNPREQ